MASSSNAGPPRIEAIDRSMQLLVALAEYGPEGTTLTELSDRTGISKPTAYRALITMRARGFVSQGREGGYRLGPQAVALSDHYFSEDNLQRLLHPVLRELSRRLEELVHLGAWDGQEVVYLDKVEPSLRTIRVWSAVGQRVPAASSALGRALLSVEDPEEAALRSLVESLPDNRHVSLERLVEAVRTARETGFSEEIEENEPGVACVGFPLLRSGRAVAAISITSVAARMTESRRRELQSSLSAELPAMLPDGISLYEPAS